MTAKLWAKQNQHEGDRARLFSAVADAIDARVVLYAGSYVDIAASIVWRSVTYVDVDRRAARFFRDTEGVREIVAGVPGAPSSPEIEFVHADYATDLALREQSFDLLVSLYAGPISMHCTRYLRVGGVLLVNPSHGDAALASLDDRYRLHAVVDSSSGGYRVSAEALDTYLIPKKQVDLTVDSILESGQGIGYTRPAFAYLFQRVV